MTNMIATFFTFGCFGGAGFAVFSLMGNGKKIEGCVVLCREFTRDCLAHGCKLTWTRSVTSLNAPKASID